MERKIKECQTIAELLALESQNVFNELEECLVFEKRMEIFLRIKEWRLENARLGLVPNLTDTWTPEQRERFLRDWQDEELPMQINRGEKRPFCAMSSDDDEPQVGRGQKKSCEGTSSDEPQVGRGQKRSFEETSNVDNEPGQEGNEVSDNIFTVQSVKQVNVKKFKTTGMDYRIQFTNAFANVELSEYHERLHEIFQSLLNEVTHGVPPHDQVRFVLHSSQLENPISFPFMPRERLTTERVLAEFERVIQSNRHFHLNESVDVNIVHVEMPHGGKHTKRAEINLEKHLMKKRSIIRIRNRMICVWRGLWSLRKPKLRMIVGIVKYETLRDHFKPVWLVNYTRMLPFLWVPVDWMKSNSFRRTFPITRSILCPKIIRTLLFILAPIRKREFISIFMIIITTLLPKCQGFLSDRTTAIHVRKLMIIEKITYARMPVNVVVFPTVPSSLGFTAMIVTGCSKVKRVSIGINSQAENRSVRR